MRNAAYATSRLGFFSTIRMSSAQPLPSRGYSSATAAVIAACEAPRPTVFAMRPALITARIADSDALISRWWLSASAARSTPRSAAMAPLAASATAAAWWP
jgi:hypothetical protein